VPHIAKPSRALTCADMEQTGSEAQAMPTLLTHRHREFVEDHKFKKQVSFQDEFEAKKEEKTTIEPEEEATQVLAPSSPVVRLIVKGTFLDVSEGDGKTRAQIFAKHGRAKTDSVLAAKDEEEEEYCPGVYADTALADVSNSSPRSADSAQHLVAEVTAEMRQPAKVEDVDWPNTELRPSREKQRATQAKTTVMMRNLPNNYTRAMLLSMLEGEGFSALVTFLYLPMDFDRHANLGYAFVNLVDEMAANAFWQAFDGFSRWALPTAKVCQIRWSGPHQGHQAHVDRYKNSPVMHASVPDEFKPMIFDNGFRISFPPPSRKLRPPTGKNEAKTKTHPRK